MLKNWPFSYKLGGGFGAILLLMVGGSWLAVGTVNDLTKASNDIYEHPFAVGKAVRDIRADMGVIHGALEDLAAAQTDVSMADAQQRIGEVSERIAGSFAILEERFLGDTARVEAAYQSYRAWDSLVADVLAQKKERLAHDARDTLERGSAPHLRALIEALEQLGAETDRRAAEYHQSAQEGVSPEVAARLTDKLYSHPYTVSNLVREVRADVRAMDRLLYEATTADTNAVLEQLKDRLAGLREEARAHFTIIRERSLGDPGAVDRAADLYDEWVDERQQDVIETRRAYLAVDPGDTTATEGQALLTSLERDVQRIMSFADGKAAELREQAGRKAAGARTTLILTTAAALALGAGLAIMITLSITRPMALGVAVAERVAEGDLRAELETDRRDEVGVLSAALSGIVTRLRETVAQAGAVASGDYSVTIEPQSARDELGTALASMSRALQQATRDRHAQDWLKTGQAELNEVLRGAPALQDLSDDALRKLAQFSGAQMAALYLVAGDGSLQLQSTYAYERTEHHPGRIEPGEGLVGQAALEQHPILLSHVPDDYASISSGLGHARPGSVYVLPITLYGTLFGVAEFAALGDFDGLALQMLNDAAEPFAIALSACRSRDRQQELLERSQAQAEELQVQEEELRQSNRELESQTTALQESQKRLQAQQEELEEINSELEERTEALQRQRNEVAQKNMELQQAQAEVEEKARDLALSSKYKSEFLANMSHELRTPLNSLLILSRLLMENKDGNLTEKQIEFAQTIHSSGADLLNLINEVLDLAKIESGKMQADLKELRLGSFFDEFGEHYRHMVETKGLEFAIFVHPDLPDFVSTDQQRFAQIIKNLLSNAVKFTSEGRIAIEVTPAEVPGPGLGAEKAPGYQVSVSDTGIGIPEDKQRLIFEAFQQADGTTARRYGGTGLGLSISRELAALLGGTIAIESEPGKGSRFILSLPLACPQTPAETPEPGPAETAAPVPAVLAGEDIPEDAPEPVTGEAPSAPETQDAEEPERVPDDRKDLAPGEKSILIIEDDNRFARLLLQLSHERGFKAIIAESGETGLHLADYYRPSAVLLDLGLPGMDGMGVIDRLKDNLSTRHIPVHVISGHERALDVRKRGAAGFLRKPANMEQLDKAFGNIERIISGPVRRLLVAEDDPATQTSIEALIGCEDVEIVTAATGAEALEQLRSSDFDCMVLDLKLPDMSGVDLLEEIRELDTIHHVPVVVFTGKELTPEESLTLDRYAERIVIKGAKSPERLLDETALFLHRVEESLPPEQRKLIRMLHDKEAIFVGKRVLIVDDDMRNVFALSSVLEERQLETAVAGNGLEALAFLEEQPAVDAVLMDIMMPELDGYETMRRIRAQEHFRRLPIIALTAKAMKGDRAKCIEAGASDYLAKPVDTDKLLSMLRVWLY